MTDTTATTATTATRTLPSVSEATFDETLAGAGVPVLVDCWAPWCGPCRVLEPVLEEVAALRPDSLLVVRADIDENPGLAVRLGVMSVPTMLLFTGGAPEPVLRLVGARGKGQILAELDAVLG